MAKNKSIFKIEGTLDEVTFYKGADGYLIRKKGGVSKNRIMNDPAFIRTRENGTEFGVAAQNGKLIRNAFTQMVKNAKDNKLVARLTQRILLVKNFDDSSVRGMRNLRVGLLSDQGKLVLNGFEFNGNTSLTTILKTPFVASIEEGSITLTNFVPSEHLVISGGATHIKLKAAVSLINFVTNQHQTIYADEVLLPLNNTLIEMVELKVSEIPEGEGSLIQTFSIEFLQSLNGIFYGLKNGMHNPMSIVSLK